MARIPPHIDFFIADAMLSSTNTRRVFHHELPADKQISPTTMSFAHLSTKAFDADRPRRESGAASRYDAFPEISLYD